MLRYGLSVLLVVTLGTCGDRGMGPSAEGQIVLSVRYAAAGSGKVVGVQRVDRMVVSLTQGGKQVQERELVYSSGSWQGVLKVGAGRYGVVVVAYKGDKVKWRGSTSVRVQAGKRSPAEVVMESTNQVPVLERIRAQQVAEGEGLRLELRGSDADGDGLTYSVAGEPEGSSFSDGVFTWTPTYQQSGTYRVTFSVADQYGGVAEETVVITVGETNREPVLASIGSQRVAEGEGLRVALSATDADGDRLRYSASGRPAGSSFSGGVFSWTPTYEQSGTYRVTFTVSDGQGGTDRETVTIAVGETNREPVLASIGTPRVAEGASLRVALSATDADGDRLTYSASGRPAGSSFSGGVFSWTPTYEQSGTYRVTFTVSDGQGGTDRETVTIAVGETNREPVLASIGWQRVAEGERLQLVVSATDADEDELTYSASGRPTGSSFSDSTFSWTPTYQQAGTYQVTFTVSDGRGGTDRKTVMITVGETNREPVLASIGAQQVAEGASLRLELRGSDADGDRLTYSASGRPTGATLSGGVFSWTPTYQQSGTYRVTFSVSDGRGGTDRETVTITVGEINRVPVLASIGAQRVAEGERLQLELSVTDADGDELTYSASDRPVGSSFSGGVFSWTPTYQQSGTYQVTFTVSDGRGGTDAETIAITVGETNREPVLASIGSQQVAEGERLQLVVSASDADGDGLTYSATGRPTGATLSDSMFSWTPSYTQAGMYRVAFSVSDGRGGTAEEAVTIIVSESKPDLVVEGAVNQSRLKVGASFTLSVTVKNAGTRAAEATTVRYYRSVDAVIGSNDEAVGTDAVGDLAVAGEREASISLTVPWETGAYYYGACVERVGDELDTRNNCSAGVQVTATAPEGPDLVVETVAVSNNRLVVEASFTLSATVLNQGQASAEATTVRYYRSEDAEIGGDDEELDTGDLGGLGASRPGDVAVRLKAPAVAGTYYYGICVDAMAGDNGVNNCSAGVEVRVTGPDLVVSAAGVSRAQIYIGESFGLSATVRNVGEEGADATTVRYYRSADRAITTGDTEVGTDEVGRLAARGSAEVETTLRMASAGVYYYGACVDRVGGEYARPNNCSAGVQVRVVGRPDVQIEDVAVSRNRVGRGESVRLSARVVNEGGSVAARAQVVYYRSSDAQITAEDARVGTGSVEGLAAGSAEGVGIDLTAPTTGGMYYYGLCVSGVSGETATGNNCSSGVALEVSGPDLVVEAVSVSSDRLPVEASFTLSATVKNAGGANASATRVRYYLSADEEIDGADEELEVAVVGGLSSGGVYDGSVRLTAPARAGVYYYGACVDGVSGEGDTGNNCSEAVVFIAMSSGGPDLVVQWVSVSGSELKPGDSFTLSASVANVGDASSSSATVVRYYVSSDSTITGSDREVGRRYIVGLDVGGTWEGEREMTVADWGVVYSGVCVDGVSGEEARGNNCSGGVRVEVEPSLGDEWAFSLPGGGEMAFVWIEPGVFQMGSDNGSSNERPVHEVEISRGFWLGKYEVTQGEWEAVMGETPWSGRAYVRSNSSHPAVYISWRDVQEFIEKLNNASGSSVYRLPTEAEWEYACRAGTQTRWSFGDAESQLTHYAWYYDNAWHANQRYAHAVGRKRPNAWGLYDMHGNVWEWVQDWYDSDYYNRSPRVDPRGPTSGSLRVSRGGSFGHGAQVVRSAYRGNYSPGYRGYLIGVRLLRLSTP